MTESTDKRINQCINDSVQFYRADLRSAYDYYPFGMLIPDRSFDSTAYIQLPDRVDTTISQRIKIQIPGLNPGQNITLTKDGETYVLAQYQSGYTGAQYSANIAGSAIVNELSFEDSSGYLIIENTNLGGQKICSGIPSFSINIAGTNYSVNCSQSIDTIKGGLLSEAGYLFGFGKYEKEKGVLNIDNLYNMGNRLYDSRLCVSYSIDPNFLMYQGITPYNFCANNPIVFFDPDGKDGIRNASNASITASIIFIYNPALITPAEAASYANFANRNISSVWGSQTYNNNRVTVNLNISFMTVTQYNQAVANGQISFDGQTNVITLTNSGRSNVNGDRRTGSWNINEVGNQPAHEFGHLLGLDDRYQIYQGYTSLTGVEFNWNVVLLPQGQAKDKGYNPYNNLMSSLSNVLSVKQLNFVFNSKNGESEGISTYSFFDNSRENSSSWRSRNSIGLKPSVFILGFDENGNLYTDNQNIRLHSISGYLNTSLIDNLDQTNFTKLLSNKGDFGKDIIRHIRGLGNPRFSSGSNTISNLKAPYN